MTAYLAVAFAALFAAGLTLYSGFGLGTLLLPVFALFYPVEVAVAATAMVHGANNAFKVSLLGRFADWKVVFRFGFPAVVFAFAGASLLGSMAAVEWQFSWRLGPVSGDITALHVLIGILMLGFALFELVPRLQKLQFDQRYLPLGGVLSGFFGGLSGHQGALRSAFLVKTGLSTQAFVGSNAVIGFAVDLARIFTYLALLSWWGREIEIPAGSMALVGTGMLAAFGGVMIGKRFLHKVTMRLVQTLTGLLLLLIAVLLGAGLI